LSIFKRLLALLLLLVCPLSAADQSAERYHHRIEEIIDFGAAVAFKDGSNWDIAPGDAYKTIGWEKGDLLIVTLNHSWFSSQPYCITNLSKSLSVKAYLKQPPVPFGPAANWIVGIDKNAGVLLLQDGSRWKAAPGDLDILRQWKINHFIIFGYNDSYFASHEYILINASSKQHIQALAF